VPFFPLGGFTPLQSSALDAAAASLQATPMQVALAWLLQRSPNILLIPGTSSVEHLRENLKAATLQLPSEMIADLDSIGVARSTDKLNVLSTRLYAKYKVRITTLSIDLADPSSPQAIAEELKRGGIQVDLLVNNAGLGLSGEFLSHHPKQEQAEIEVNVQALVALTHYFGKAMAARGKGGIINVASNASFQPLPYMATYAASKAFVLHFSEAIGHELAGRGIHVMATFPGPTATSFFDDTSTHMSPKDMDSSESVVRRTLEAFDRRRAVAYPGRIGVRIASWLPRLLPRALVARIGGMATVKMGLHD
jgi:short-subunit dehydrogenase